jgi:hypothetical protein
MILRSLLRWRYIYLSLTVIFIDFYGMLIPDVIFIKSELYEVVWILRC